MAFDAGFAPTQLAALRAIETGLHVTELEARWLTARGLIDASHKLTAKGLKTLRAHLGEDKPYDPNDFGGT